MTDKQKLQEIFDRVVNHLLTQKRKALRGLACVYKAPDGCSCAVGCLITDEYYSEDLERQVVARPAIQDAVAASLRSSGLERDLADLLSSLQGIHDQIDVRSWHSSLEALALRRGLQFNWHGPSNSQTECENV